MSNHINPLRRLAHAIPALIIVLSALLVPAVSYAARPVDMGRTALPQTPIVVTLTIDQAPRLGDVATVTCQASTSQPAPGTTLTIKLPASAQTEAGELSWQGDLAVDQPATLSAQVRFTAPGDTTISCRALRPVDGKNSWGDLKAVYLSIAQEQSQFGFAAVAPAEQVHFGDLKTPGDGQLLDESEVNGTPFDPDRVVPPAPAKDPAPPATPYDLPAASPGQGPEPGKGTAPVTVPVPAPAQPQTSPPAAGVAEVPAGDLTVTGNWAYFDRDDNYVGALEMLVELVRGDNYGHLAWCFTDPSGNYACGPVTNPGGVGVRTLLHSWTNYNPNGDVLAVVNPDWGTSNAIANTFRTQTGVSVFPDGTHNIGSWFVLNGDNYERAYWVQREVNDTWRFTYFNGLGGTATSGPSTTQWKIDSTDGTYYVPGGNVHLAGVDPLGKSVAMHEYSHNVMYNIYGNYMPPNPSCNPHSIPGATSQGCAWTEGFAEFIPSVVSNDPTFYWPSGASLDLEYPTWGSFGWGNGDTVEGRVAGALWDMYDNHDDGDDIYSDGGFVNFWDTFYYANNDVMSQFWNSWRSRGHDNSSGGPIMDLYQNTINYRSGPANDDFQNAAVVTTIPYNIIGLPTQGATTQGLDPLHPCGSVSTPRQSRSVWYAYTPSITGNYRMDTQYSDYDTVLAVWSGYWGGLVNVACDDDSGGNWTSALNVTLQGGTTYYIEATRYGNSDGGLLHLWINLNPPPNDDFDYALAASGASYSDYENTINATTAGDDPSFVCGAYHNGQGSHSVWYTIASAYNRVLTADTLTSSYDTVLAVWTGSRGALSLAACNDDTGGTLQSLTQVALQAGTLYHIEALGYSSNSGALNFATNLGPICPDFVAPAGVGVEDISAIASLWGQVVGPPYDYDGDSIITIYDISQVTPLWGQDCLAVTAPPEGVVDPSLK